MNVIMNILDGLFKGAKVSSILIGIVCIIVYIDRLARDKTVSRFLEYVLVVPLFFLFATILDKIEDVLELTTVSKAAGLLMCGAGIVGAVKILWKEHVRNTQ